MNYNDNLLKHRGVFCNAPFRSLMINAKGDCYFCAFAFGKNLDSFLGNILDVEDAFNDIWNGENARKIRKSILDGTYEHCYSECGNLNARVGRVSYISDKDKEAGDYITQGINEEEIQIISTQDVILKYAPTDIILSAEKCNLKCP